MVKQRFVHDLPGHYVETEFDEIISLEEYLGEDFPEVVVPGYEPRCENYDESSDMCMDWLYDDE